MKRLILYILFLIPLFGLSQGVTPPSTGSPPIPAGGGVPGLIAGGPVNASPTPSLTTSVSSLSGFSTTAGTASASQTFTVSGSNLTANATITAPASYEVSNNGSSYASTTTLTQSGGTISAATVWVRIAASASAGSPSGNVAVSSTGATTQNVTVSGTVNAATAAFFNFSGGAAALGTINGNFWNNVATSAANVNPGTISATDASTGWKVQSNGSGAWNGFGGFFGGTGNGPTGSTDGVFTAAVISSGNLYTYDAPFSGTYLFTITGLPAGNYTLKFANGVSTGSFTDGGTMSVHVKVGTGSDQIASPSGFSPNNNNTLCSISITVTTGQSVQFGGFTDATGSNNLGWNSAMSITKN